MEASQAPAAQRHREPGCVRAGYRHIGHTGSTQSLAAVPREAQGGAPASPPLTGPTWTQAEPPPDADVRRRPPFRSGRSAGRAAGRGREGTWGRASAASPPRAAASSTRSLPSPRDGGQQPGLRREPGGVRRFMRGAQPGPAPA